MKILIVSQYFNPESFSVNEIAAYLASKGHEVDVLTGIPNYPQGKFYNGYGLFKRLKETQNGVHIKRVWIKARGQRGGDKRLILNYVSYAINASFIILGRLNRKYEATFVYAMSPITQAYPALLLRKLKKVPMCLYVGDLWPDTLFSHGVGSGVVEKIVTEKCREIYRKSDRIIVVNKSFEQPVSDYAGTGANITYIPQSVEPIYKPMQPDHSLRRALGIDDGDFIVMFAGNLGFAQSVTTVIQAAKLLSKEKAIRFVFLGDGSQKTECEAFCAENRMDQCYFIGRRPQEDMPKLIAEADAMLVTLKNQSNYNLTLPGRTQAFMACGKPILCCANGETARVIRESGAGLVCEAENSESLAGIVSELYRIAPDKRELLGRNGLNYSAEHYNRNEMLSEIEYVVCGMRYGKQ